MDPQHYESTPWILSPSFRLPFLIHNGWVANFSLNIFPAFKITYKFMIALKLFQLVYV
jgi:hypothetical protein